MKVSRDVKTSVEEGVKKMVTDRYRYRGTNHQILDQNLDRFSRCREAIEEAKAFSIDQPSVEELSGLR